MTPFEKARDAELKRRQDLSHADFVKEFPDAGQNYFIEYDCNDEAPAFKSGADWALQYTLDHGPVALAFVYRQAQERQVSRIATLEAALRDIRDNYDCDSDAHKYGTNCRCCTARKALEKEASK